MRTSLLLLLPALLLAGCNDSDAPATAASPPPAGPAPVAVTVTPSLGQVINGSVTLEQLGGAWSASGTTGSSGLASFLVPADLAGPFLITVCGSATGQYFDEALLSLSALGPAQCLRAVTPDLTRTNVGVTAFSEAATQYLENQVGNLETATSTQASNALEVVREQALPELDDLLLAPVVVGADTPVSSLPDTPAGRFALKLAGLARAADALGDSRGVTLTAPAFAFAEALGLDLADGTLDGQDGSSYIVSPAYDIHQLGTLLETELDELAAENSSLQALVDSLDSETLLAITAPTGGDALISWQGSYSGTWNGNATAGGFSLSGALGAFSSQVISGTGCGVNIGNGTLSVEGLPWSFDFDLTPTTTASGTRSYVFTRNDNVSFSVSLGGFGGTISLPAAMTTTVTLNMQGDVLKSVAVESAGVTSGMLAIDVSLIDATCTVSAPT
ncbi:MAG: hypothetical protein K0R03_1579 [Moraxellaceae bacterium]|jgi:hypothetical protein|nr:hypothetical protein [Moraxellaceae bacterium]